MSKKSVDKTLNNVLKNLVDRHTVQSSKGGQLLVLDSETVNTFEDALFVFIPEGLEEEIRGFILNAVATEGAEAASKAQQKFKQANPRGYGTTLSYLTRKGNSLGARYTQGGNLTPFSFLIESFEDARKVKTAILNKVFQDLKTKNIELSRKEQTQVAKNIHRGHGAGGFAVAEVKIASSLARLEALSKQKGQISKALVTFGNQYNINVDTLNRLKYLVSNFSHVVTKKGTLRASYVSVLTYDSMEDNTYDSIFEGEALRVFNEEFVPYFVKNFTSTKGSPSITDKIAHQLTKNSTPKQTKHVKVKTTAKDVPSKSSVTSKVKGKQSAKGNSKKARKKGAQVKPSAGAAPKSVLPDIRQFIGVLNSRINTEVAKNMGSPRLNYRTGRFAESVRITDITRTNQGFPSIGYTYMRNPYEVFEHPGTGNPLAQEGQRDPRTLIDKSIREIMAEYAVGRFYTRRV